jgi:hypothetical protein
MGFLLSATPGRVLKKWGLASRGCLSNLRAEPYHVLVVEPWDIRASRMRVGDITLLI